MKKALIIGAGPAGLTAALELLRRSTEYSVTVLESDIVAGGISRTVNVNGSRMDIGGHRFYTKSDRVMKFWKSIMPEQGAPSADELKTGSESVLAEGGADPEKYDEVLLNRRRVSRIYQKGRFYDYPISMNTLKTMGFGAVFAGTSYLASRIKKRRENTLEDFYINRFGKRLYSDFFSDYTKKVWGISPSEMPPDWGAQRVRGLSLQKTIRDMLTGGKSKEVSLIKRFLYPKFGPGQMWEAAAKQIEGLGGRIIYDSHVSEIKIKDSEIISVKAGKTEYTADVFISSMPLSELIAAMGEGKPSETAEAAADLCYRDFITVGVEAKRLKIKNNTKNKTVNDIPCDCWIYVQDPGVRMGRIQIFNNWSPYMVRDFESMVYLGTEYFCSEGDELWRMSDCEMGNLAASELVKMGILEERDIISVHCERVKKAYPSYIGGYEKIGKIRSFANSIQNLYCIGRNGQHRYNNMDHSMLTAMTAADIILDGGNRESIWTVNPDDEYAG